MTAFEPFDPFERRITEAIDEIAAARPPAYLDDVLRLTARSRQRARWALPERWLKVNRLSLAAVALALVLLAGGGAYILLGNRSSVGPAGPTPTPTATATPASTPLADLSRFGLGRGMGYPSTVPSDLLAATWIADVDAIQGLFHDSRIRMSSTGTGEQLVVAYGLDQPPMSSRAVTGGAEYLSLLSLVPGSGCVAGDFGDYAIRPSDDGLRMTLDPRVEVCATRRSLMARTWTRSFDAPSQGGRGVLTTFDPFVAVTLPDAPFSTDNGTDSANLSSASLDRTLIAVKNPTGWSDPCSANGGTNWILKNTAAAFTAYMKAVPGFTVHSESLSIDGRPAIHLTIPSTATPACQPPNGRVMEWGTGDPANTGGWFINQGDTDVIYLVEVGSDLYLLQWLGANVTPAEELQVLSTVHFIDALPTTP